MNDEQTLQEASRLLRKYFHPSRLGYVPPPELASDLEVTEVLLKFAAVKAAEEG